MLPPPLPGAGNFDVELVLKGPGTPEQMAEYAGQARRRRFGSGKFMFADTDLKIDLPQVRVVIDRERVADLGLDLADVGRQLGIALGGNYVNRFTLEGRAYKVIPQVDGGRARRAAPLLDYKIRTRDGEQVPISSFANSRPSPRRARCALPADRQLPGLRRRNPGVTKAEACMSWKRPRQDPAGRLHHRLRG